MEKQVPLFPRASRAVTFPQESREPRLWVRRLILWAEPGVAIREVTLRRGLNIVWSPDPGVAAAELGGDGGSGHGAGKSLFCRLLRYCLGEETFATDDLHAAVGAKFPKGLVGAEVVIGDRTWGVVRPLGATRKTIVAEAAPEDLVTSETRRTGMAPLFDALNEELQLADIQLYMPGTAEARAWLVPLAWLTRDQEARFGHLLDWRHPRTDSRSPASGLSKDELVLAVRLMLGALTAAELAQRNEAARFAGMRQHVERELIYLERVTEQRRSRLASLFGTVVDGPLTAQSVGTQATTAAEALESELGRPADAELENTQQRLEEVIIQHALITRQRDDFVILGEVHREQLKLLRGEHANLDVESLKARFGPMCPICQVPIEKALAAGCGLSLVTKNPTEIEGAKRELSEQIKDMEAAIRNCEAQAREREVLVSDSSRTERELRADLIRIRDRIQAADRRLREKWLEAKRAMEDAAQLSRAYEDLNEMQAQLETASSDETRVQQLLEEMRKQSAAAIGRLSQLFDYVCTGLLGPGADARLTLTGQGFRTDVRVGGTAMASLKAIAFDIAAMLLSIEGKTHLPAFFIHDSPREADLGISHYHKLFRFARELEALRADAPFQYIVTTTTDPPDELRMDPYVVLKLSGTEESERLLRCSLTPVP